MNFVRKTLLAFVAGSVIVSCSRNNDSVTETPTAQADPINNFIWKGLNSWYYWQDKVPNLADNRFATVADYNTFLNSNTDHSDFFYSLLYNYPNIDRNSWIVDNVNDLMAQFSGVSKSSGMDASFFLVGSTGGVGALVNYVVPNSPAAQGGVKRGDFVYAVNGTNLTTNNYQTLLGNDPFTVSVAHTVSVDNGSINYSDTQDVQITPVTLEENPVAFYKTYSQGTHKVGYLVYNGFQSNYNAQLNAAFAQMKTDGVTDLILDLRYNGGGSVETAIGLGQMITGQFTGQPYVSLVFNQKHTDQNETGNLSNQINTYSFSNGQTTKTGTETINSLGLSKVYVLTSGGTASASELTIYGLKAYIPVVKIGETTYGKFVGSITLVDDPSSDYTNLNNRNPSDNWAMQPIVFAYMNGKKDPIPVPSADNKNGGIVPDYPISFSQYFGHLKEFGNTIDPALAEALQLITGVVPQGAIRSKSVMQQLPQYKFLGNNKTLMKFGTEMYLQDFKLK